MSDGIRSKRPRDLERPSSSFLSSVHIQRSSSACNVPSLSSPQQHATLLGSLRSSMTSTAAAARADGTERCAAGGVRGGPVGEVPCAPVPAAPSQSDASTSRCIAPPPSWDATTVRSLLKQTNLAHLRDASIVAWLRDACEWIHETSSQPDIRFLVLRVLDTLPWWRYMRVLAKKDDHHLVEEFGPSSSPVSVKETSAGRVSRNHAKTFAHLERLCILLVSASPHAVRGVIEITMKPFTCFPVAARESEGLAPVIPVDMVCRVWNCVATRYPHLVPDTLLWQCVEPLMPRRRYPHVAQHIAFLKTLLHLALDATLTPQEEVEGMGEIRVSAHDPRPGDDSTFSDATAKGGTPGSSSLYDSDATTTPSSAARLVGEFPHQSHSAADPAHATLPNLRSLLDASVAHNNRLMVHRNAIIQLVLRHLLDMELSFATTPVERRGSGSLPWQSRADPKVDPHDLGAYDVLRRCTDAVAERLAEDLEAQGIAGSCGNASWWREVQSFHVNSVLMLDRPVVIHTLAPRLAMLGAGGEVADLVHRVVTTVLKGIVHAPSSSSTTAGPKHSSGRGPPRAAMAAPMMAPQVLPTDRRVAAARHIGPLVVAMTMSASGGSSAQGGGAQHEAQRAGTHGAEVLLDNEVAVGAIRRMLKWLASEGEGAAGGSPRVPLPLLEAVFAQTEFLSQRMRVPLKDLSDDVVQSLRATLRGDASVASGAEVSCAIHRGLVLPFLYGAIIPPAEYASSDAAKKDIP